MICHVFAVQNAKKKNIWAFFSVLGGQFVFVKKEDMSSERRTNGKSTLFENRLGIVRSLFVLCAMILCRVIIWGTVINFKLQLMRAKVVPLLKQIDALIVSIQDILRLIAQKL